LCYNLLMEKPVIRISVRNLVEFILRSGDLDIRVGASADREAMLAGSRVHRKIQKSRKGGYESEVFLSGETEFEDLIIRVEGRADGIDSSGSTQEASPEQLADSSTDPEQKKVIEEIKGIYRDLEHVEEPVPVHLAQAKCYAALLAERDSLSEAGVRMIYVNLDTERTKTFDYSYTASELKTWYEGLMAEYHKWAKFLADHRKERDESMQDLPFPFPYRKGQRELVASVWHTISEQKELFIEAPTGVGKTMSAVFPAVRALGAGQGDRIFYLTSKTVTRTVGLEAFAILRSRGLKIKLVSLTAKEKLCPMNEPSCNPDDCPYAKGHFDRINDAVYDLLQQTDLFDRDTILRQAEERKVCPFELSLDVSSWTDAVICDYNYVFDPNVRLKRFFSEGMKSDAILLIDEAHNLVERGREMYSASLTKEHVLAAKKTVKEKDPALAKGLEKLNKQMLSLKRECDEYAVLETAGVLVLSLLPLVEKMQDFLQEKADAEEKKALQDFWFEMRDFLSVSEIADENYVTYSELNEDGEFSVKLFCVNPASNLQKCIDRARCAVLFSATMLPISYYKKLLSTHDDDYAIYADTPFLPGQKLLLIGRDVSTRYRTRGEKTYERIARYLHDTASMKKGNYLAFFPSYKMMQDVFEVYRDRYDEEGINWVVQTPMMREEDREMFLENFYEDPKDTLIGFCVMGGIFSEGIDLTGTRLIGAIVIGTGLPQISNEKEILRDYYDKNGGDGFGYAYRIPGMNKVLQAAGRVIRTVTDRGIILLLDDRFLTQEYAALFPREWTGGRTVRVEEIKEVLRSFWNVV
jgi:DNA excision repair protein ERCC-2